MNDFRLSTPRTVFSTIRHLLGPAALVVVCAAAPVVAQTQADSERASRIESALAPHPRDDAAYINRIIQMEVPQPGGHRAVVTLNYNHTVDLAVFYEFDSAALTPQAKALLTDLGRALISDRLSASIFLLAGHTDAKGSAAYNQNLSERRALEARRFLTEHFGILPGRLIAVGFGEEHLADPARPLDPINRRVEITLLEKIVPLSAYEADNSGAPEMAAAGEVPPECVGVDPGTDPVPDQTGLDDFGGEPTDVLCAPRAADGDAGSDPTPDDGSADQDGAGDDSGQTENPAGNQNSAINN